MSFPAVPRDYSKLSFAPTAVNALGGSPGCGVVFKNKLIYPYGTYTPGTNTPQIRVFDGVSDKVLCSLPNNVDNVMSKGVVSMLAANGLVYISTFDAGSSSADWEGRVIELDPDSGSLTTIGARFTGGGVPYSLAWHMGRLWCGTNDGAASSVGKLYFIRPNIDTSWTEDATFTSSYNDGVSSLLSYKGNLYVGMTRSSAGFSPFLVYRDYEGAYTGVEAASGASGSGYPAMIEFGGNLYISYYSTTGGTPTSLIKKWDNSSLSTVYTGASATRTPFVKLVVDGSTMYAIGGGPSGLPVKQAVLLSTTNGTSYTDLSAQLLGSSTALPLYGVISL